MRRLLLTTLVLLSTAALAGVWTPATNQSACTASKWCKLDPSIAGTPNTWAPLVSSGGPVAVLSNYATSQVGPPRWATECWSIPNDPRPSRIGVSFTVSNTGGATLTVSSISGTQVTTVSPTPPFTVIAGGSQQVLVYNTPCTFITPTGTVYTNGGNLSF